MYIHIQSAYNGIMPITLTQLEDKVIAAAQRDRPGDIKGIIRAVSYVMGTLTQPYSHEKLQTYNAIDADRNCVQDYISQDDDIDLATFYDLCYLSRQIDALENKAYGALKNGDWSFVESVERATRCVIEGHPLHLAIMLVTGKDVVDTDVSGYSPASYWAPANNYRFGETFTYKDAHQLAFLTDDNRVQLYPKDDVDMSFLKSVPSSDLADVLLSIDKPELIIDRESSHESVLQEQKRWALQSKSADDVLSLLGYRSFFVSCFMRDDELLSAFKQNKNDYRMAASVYLATVKAFDFQAGLTFKKKTIRDLQTYLLDPQNASEEARQISLTQFDVSRIVSMLYFVTALDSNAISFFHRKWSELYFNDVTLKRFVTLMSPDEYKDRASLTEKELQLRVDQHNVYDIVGESICVIISSAREIVEYFTPGMISSLLQEVNTFPAKENAHGIRYAYYAKSPSARRTVLERRINELV